MTVEEYIQTKQKLLKEFERFWKSHETDPTFPNELEFVDWEEQEEFFECSLDLD